MSVEGRELRFTQSFVAPELVDSTSVDPQDIMQRPIWDVAIRYQDLKRLGNITDKDKLLLKRRAVDAVLLRARNILGSVMKPDQPRVLDLIDFRASGSRGEINIEETFETGELHFDSRVEKESSIALIMDASLSMTGEKIALLAVAAAVVALTVPGSRLALMGFDSRVRWVKRFGETKTPAQIVEGVLELPSGGFTNLEMALSEMNNTLSREHFGHANVILISDGKYTEGKDPLYLAKRYRHLNVLKIGRDQAGRDLLLDIVSSGNGKFFEARKMEELPKSMYGAVRSLLR